MNFSAQQRAAAKSVVALFFSALLIAAAIAIHRANANPHSLPRSPSP